MNVRHKYLVQAQKNKEVSVEWCLGKAMLADALTKALGGPLLRDFTKHIFCLPSDVM
jgi:hypothetical protein